MLSKAASLLGAYKYHKTKPYKDNAMRVDTVHEKETRPILLNVPIDLLEQLDEASVILRLPRTRLILRSLNRELQTDLRDEVARHQKTLEQDFSWPLV